MILLITFKCQTLRFWLFLISRDFGITLGVISYTDQAEPSLADNVLIYLYGFKFQNLSLPSNPSNHLTIFTTSISVYHGGQRGDVGRFSESSTRSPIIRCNLRSGTVVQNRPELCTEGPDVHSGNTTADRQNNFGSPDRSWWSSTTSHLFRTEEQQNKWI
ncbi:hypothetical protein BT69DRAFT_867893 [Atractiella rhizophila]|nr:hypothetical protein BT69DRAFT_867893 [Atractiella rhizophila]